MKIQKNTKYKIKGKSKYFKGKYGTSNPIITIENEHKKVLGRWWGGYDGNITCMLYGVRNAVEYLPLDNGETEEVYYGKIDGLGELVHISELEEVNNE